jgi:hypothetical protein
MEGGEGLSRRNARLRLRREVNARELQNLLSGEHTHSPDDEKTTHFT